MKKRFAFDLVESLNQIDFIRPLFLVLIVVLISSSVDAKVRIWSDVHVNSIDLFKIDGFDKLMVLLQLQDDAGGRIPNLTISIRCKGKREIHMRSDLEGLAHGLLPLSCDTVNKTTGKRLNQLSQGSVSPTINEEEIALSIRVEESPISAAYAEWHHVQIQHAKPYVRFGQGSYEVPYGISARISAELMVGHRAIEGIGQIWGRACQSPQSDQAIDDHSELRLIVHNYHFGEDQLVSDLEAGCYQLYVTLDGTHLLPSKGGTLVVTKRLDLQVNPIEILNGDTVKLSGILSHHTDINAQLLITLINKESDFEEKIVIYQQVIKANQAWEVVKEVPLRDQVYVYQIQAHSSDIWLRASPPLFTKIYVKPFFRISHVIIWFLSMMVFMIVIYGLFFLLSAPKARLPLNQNDSSYESISRIKKIIEHTNHKSVKVTFFDSVNGEGLRGSLLLVRPPNIFNGWSPQLLLPPESAIISKIDDDQHSMFIISDDTLIELDNHEIWLWPTVSGYEPTVVTLEKNDQGIEINIPLWTYQNALARQIDRTLSMLQINAQFGYTPFTKICKELKNLQLDHLADVLVESERGLYCFPALSADEYTTLSYEIVDGYGTRCFADGDARHTISLIDRDSSIV